jgi:hypothetical protein
LSTFFSFFPSFLLYFFIIDYGYYIY